MNRGVNVPETSIFQNGLNIIQKIKISFALFSFKLFKKKKLSKPKEKSLLVIMWFKRKTKKSFFLNKYDDIIISLKGEKKNVTYQQMTSFPQTRCFWQPESVCR